LIKKNTSFLFFIFQDGLNIFDRHKIFPDSYLAMKNTQRKSIFKQIGEEIADLKVY